MRSRRALGRTRFDVSRIGAGDVADPGLPFDECVGILRHALDAGINLVDTAPNYSDGLSERIVGAAVRDRRDSVFVIDKIDHVDAPVRSQLDASLERLQLPYVDAIVLHAVSSIRVVEDLRRPGGAFDQLADCVSAGKARFRGISSHHPEVLRVAIDAGVCDIAMFPLGPFVDPRYVDEILPLAKSHGVGTVCFKTFGAGMLIGDTAGYGAPLDGPGGLPRLTVRECVHYTLTLDPDVALLGMSTIEEQEAALAAAADFRPLSDAEMADIRRRAVEARKGKGKTWWNPDPAAESF